MSLSVNQEPSYEEEELDYEFEDIDEEALVKQRNMRAEKMARIQEQIAKETKVKIATESMLQLYLNGAAKDPLALQEVQAQLDASVAKIKALQRQYDQYKTYNEQQNAKTRPRKSSDKASDSPDQDISLRKSGSVSTIPHSWRYRLNHFRADTVSGINTRRRPALNILKEGVMQNLTELLAKLNSKEGTSQNKLDALSALAKVVKSTKVEPFQNVEDILKALRIYLCSSVQELRAASYRVIRFLVTDLPTGKAAWSIGLSVFLVRSLSRDSKYDTEREQALKLVRTFIDVPETAKLIPKSVVNALAALSEQTDDKLRNIALLTLCELTVANIALVASAGALRCIFQTLVDGSLQSMDFVIPTISFIMDTPETRAFVNPHTDIEMVISNFTDAYNKGQNQEERLRACSKGIASLLKTWSGLLILSTGDFYSIKCLVDSLRLPYEDNKKFLLETLFEIFQIEVPKWLPDFVSVRNAVFPSALTTPSPNQESPIAAGGVFLVDGYRLNERSNLPEHYMSLILVIFIEAGLLEALVSIIEEASKPIMTRAAILIGGLLQLSNKLLPTSYCIRVQSLPKLFELAATFDDENLRNIGSWSLAQIERLSSETSAGATCTSTTTSTTTGTIGGVGAITSTTNTATTHSIINNNIINSYNNINSRFSIPFINKTKNNSHAINAQRQLESIKVRLGLQVDDLHFKSLLGDSQVLLIKDYQKWNWDIISEIVQGPLLHPRRLEETLKNTKFVKRLLAFYRPNKHRFSDIKVGKNLKYYTATGCALFRTLLSNTEGVRFLSENKFFPQLAESFQELDPMTGFNAQEQVFSKERMESTLTGDYFQLLEVICRYREGIELLERHRIFNCFYHLTELRSRDDVIKAMISCLDYSSDGHSRIILSKVMTSGYKHIRLFATSFLRMLILNDNNQFAEWGVKLLITQLYDPSIEVCENAVMALDEACQNPQNLSALIALRPSLDHLSEIGNPLLFRFMSTATGLEFLVNEMDYIEKEVEFWFREGNVRYVIQMETSLAKAFYPQKKFKVSPTAAFNNKSDIQYQSAAEDGICIPHFYGEIVKTEEGCLLLKQKGHFDHFCSVIKSYRKDCQSVNVLDLKAALWAVGNIGGSSRGIAFLEQSNIINDVIALSENAQVLSVRGTCYYILGLISNNPEATEILEDFGWNSVSSLYRNTGVCVPVRLKNFLSVPKWHCKSIVPTKSFSLLFQSKDSIETEILKNIGNLSNQILANAASKSLNKLKHENSKYFQDLNLYLTVLKILGVYHYRLTARKFITDLFDGVDLSETIPSSIDSTGIIVDSSSASYHNLSNLRSNKQPMTPEILRKRGQVEEISKSAANLMEKENSDARMKPRKFVEGFL